MGFSVGLLFHQGRDADGVVFKNKSSSSQLHILQVMQLGYWIFLIKKFLVLFVSLFLSGRRLVDFL